MFSRWLNAKAKIFFIPSDLIDVVFFNDLRFFTASERLRRRESSFQFQQVFISHLISAFGCLKISSLTLVIFHERGNICEMFTLIPRILFML